MDRDYAILRNACCRGAGAQMVTPPVQRTPVQLFVVVDDRSNGGSPVGQGMSNGSMNGAQVDNLRFAHVGTSPQPSQAQTVNARRTLQNSMANS